MIAKKEADIAIVYVRGVVYVVLIRTGAKETVPDVRTCCFTRRYIGCVSDGGFFSVDCFLVCWKYLRQLKRKRRLLLSTVNFTQASQQ